MKKKILSCAVALTMSASMAATFMPQVSVLAKTKTVELTMFNADGNADTMSNWHDPISKILQAKTGTKITQSFAVGDVSQKVSVMLASGKLPDLMFVKGDQNKFVAARKFIDLKPLIEKYGPNIKKVYGKYYKRLTISDPKGKAIYVLPSNPVAGKNYNQQGFCQIQADVLKESGYPLVNTFAKYEQVIKAYYKKHPKINGQKAIPLSINADDWYIYISVNNPATYSAGYPDDGGYDIDSKGNCKMLVTSNAHKQFYKWLNKLNDEGLLDPESFVQKNDQWKAKMASGRVLSTFAAWWMFGDAQSSLRKSDESRVFIPQPMTAKAGIKDVEMRPTGFNPGNGIGITTSASKAKAIAAIKLFNYMCSDEGQVLTHWGIKGTNYTIVNGKRTRTAKDIKASAEDKYYGKKTGVGQYGYPFPERGLGLKDSKGDYYTPTSPYSDAEGYTKTEKAAAKAYKVTVFRELFPGEDTIPESKWGAAWQASMPATDPSTVISKKLDTLQKQAVPAMILAKPSEFEAKWKKFVEDSKDLGQAKVEAAWSKLIKERMKLLGN